MKKLSSILMIAAAAMAFQACKSSSNNSSSTTDSTTVTKDSTTKVVTSTAPVDKGDSIFVVTADSLTTGWPKWRQEKMAQNQAASAHV